MAVIHLDFESSFTGCNEDVDIIVPDRKRTETPEQFYLSGRKYPVLWLLHGTFGGHSDWLRKSNIELYACEHDLIVVMPSVMNTDYEAWDNFTLGYDSHRYITEELMPLVYGWLPASRKREDNYIAGLSMGGGGALKLALSHPDMFNACAVLSAIPREFDPEQLEKLYAMKHSEVNTSGNSLKPMLRQYNSMHRFDSAEEYLASSANTWRMVDEAAGKKDLPRFLFACGTEDPLMYTNGNYDKFREHCRKIGFKAEFISGPGSHEWRVWDRDIQKALKFFGFGSEQQGNAF